MEVEVKKSQICGEVICPPSKSYSHRAIMISSLASGKSHIENILLSRDTIASIDCVRMLGVSVNFLDNKSNDPGRLNFDNLENYSAVLVSGTKQGGDNLDQYLESYSRK